MCDCLRRGGLCLIGGEFLYVIVYVATAAVSRVRIWHRLLSVDGGSVAIDSL